MGTDLNNYKGKTVVIKYGGSAMTNDVIKESVMADVAALSCAGVKVVLVHGGGKELTNLLEKVGKQSVFVSGLRVTDRETVDYALMVFCGKINKELTLLLGRHGAKAVGICGIDGGTLLAKQKDEKLGYVGEVTKVDGTLIRKLTEEGFIPVISSVGFGENGEIFNINADTVAGSVAASLKADTLVMMTDICGICRDKHDESTLIREISLSDAERMKEDGTVGGGMIPKVECCVTAIKAGVNKVCINDGRKPHSLISQLTGESESGTVFYK